MFIDFSTLVESGALRRIDVWPRFKLEVRKYEANELETITEKSEMSCVLTPINVL